MMKLRVTQWFFDSAHVVARVTEPHRRILSKIGAYVRRSARSSIRKRNRPAPPGSPPSSHAGLLRQHIYFSYDPVDENVIIGPALLDMGNDEDGRPAAGTVPQTLELGGGMVVIESELRPGRWRRLPRRERRKFSHLPTRRRVVKIEPRPYMRPALEANLQHIPIEFRDSARGP